MQREQSWIGRRVNDAIDRVDNALVLAGAVMTLSAENVRAAVQSNREGVEGKLARRDGDAQVEARHAARDAGAEGVEPLEREPTEAELGRWEEVDHEADPSQDCAEAYADVAGDATLVHRLHDGENPLDILAGVREEARLDATGPAWAGAIEEVAFAREEATRRRAEIMQQLQAGRPAGARAANSNERTFGRGDMER